MSTQIAKQVQSPERIAEARSFASHTLATLPAGQGGRILALTGQSDVRRRLTSLGITPGSWVTHLRTAPLGDPIQVSLGSFEVCLRKDLANLILIGES